MQESPGDPARNVIPSEGSMFRAMKAEADGLPKVGRSSRELGIRIGGPLQHGDTGNLVAGGFSVARNITGNKTAGISMLEWMAWLNPETGGMSALDATRNKAGSRPSQYWQEHTPVASSRFSQFGSRLAKKILICVRSP